MPRNLKRKPEATFYRDLGCNLRAARTAAGKSQAEIAQHLHTTFQQIQKYEKGENRITIYGLVNFADYLELPLSQFVAPSDRDSEFHTLAAQFGAKQFYALMESWGAIQDRQARAALLNLVRRMADLKC